MNGWVSAAAPVVVAGMAVATAVACVDRAQPGIVGRVRQAPCGRPVVEGEPVCLDLPVVADVVVTDSTGVERVRARTAHDGSFGVLLRQSGDYTVTVDTGDPRPTWPDCPVTKVTVRGLLPTRIGRILCGSGRR
jgi:hypothetical protein